MTLEHFPDDPQRQIEIAPHLMATLADLYDAKKIQMQFGLTAQQELEKLGRLLVGEVKRRTPRSTGKLARSTKFRIITGEDSATGNVERELQIIQDALSRQTTTGSRRYFYWYSVHHGLAPAGRLSNTFPPAENLLPWVRRTFPGADEKKTLRKARSVAFKIYKEGIPPNPYLQESVDVHMAEIQATANRIRQQIVLDLTTLPDIAEVR
jgi:hypothetical protein